MVHEIQEMLDPRPGRVTRAQPPHPGDYQYYAGPDAPEQVEELSVKLAGSASVQGSPSGFVSITMNPSKLREGVLHAPSPPLLGADKILVDYSSPNLAKSLHVGHLRSTIIGDALVRVLDFLGHEVAGCNHVGDWGLPIAKVATHLLDQPGGVNSLGAVPLNVLYREAVAKYQGDATFQDRTVANLLEIQRGQPGMARTVWGMVREHSLRENQKTYDRLGVLLGDADLMGESSHSERVVALTAELLQSGKCQVDKGAVCLFYEKGRTPLILRRADGTYTYAGVDLAALRYRVQCGYHRIIYVVDDRQRNHILALRAAAESLGWLGGCRVQLVNFGIIQGADHRPLKSRDGEAPSLEGLIQDAEAGAHRALGDHRAGMVDPHDAMALGVGTLKHLDLRNPVGSNYVFDLTRMSRAEGSPLAYVMYAYVRARKLIARLGWGHLDESWQATNPGERVLALRLGEFWDTLEDVDRELAPHLLARYLEGLAGDFSRFYERCPVVGSDTEGEGNRRLALVAATLQVCERGLSLLGVTPLGEM